MRSLGRLEMQGAVSLPPYPQATESLFVDSTQFAIRNSNFPGNLNTGGWNMTVDPSGNAWAMHGATSGSQGLYRWLEADPTQNRAEYPSVTGRGGMQVIGDWLVYIGSNKVIQRRPLSNPSASVTTIFTASSGTVNENIGSVATQWNGKYIFSTAGSSIFNTFNSVWQIDVDTMDTERILTNGDSNTHVAIAASERLSYVGDRLIIRYGNNGVYTYHYPQSVINDLSPPISPSPGPDATSISYFMEEGIWVYWNGGVSDIYVHNIDTGTRVAVSTSEDDGLLNGRWKWHPESNMIIADAASIVSGSVYNVGYREADWTNAYPALGGATHSEEGEKYVPTPISSTSSTGVYDIVYTRNCGWSFPRSGVEPYAIRFEAKAPVVPEVEVPYIYIPAKWVTTSHDEQIGVAVTADDYLVTFDLRNLPNLSTVGSATQSTTLDNPTGLAIIDGYAIVTTSSSANRVASYRISNPTAPVLVNSVSTTRPINMRRLRDHAGVFYEGNGNRLRQATVASTGGVSISSIQIQHATLLGGAQYFDTYKGRYVVAKATVGNCLTLVDFAFGATPVILQSVAGYTGQWTAGGEVRIFGDYAYVTNDGTGANQSTLSIYYIGGPTLTPVSVLNIARSLFPGNGRPSDVAVVGNRAYLVSSFNQEIYVVDITNKAAPVQLTAETITTQSIRGNTGDSRSHIIAVGDDYLLTTGPSVFSLNSWALPL